MTVANPRCPAFVVGSGETRQIVAKRAGFLGLEERAKRSWWWWPSTQVVCYQDLTERCPENAQREGKASGATCHAQTSVPVPKTGQGKEAQGTVEAWRGDLAVCLWGWCWCWRLEREEGSEDVGGDGMRGERRVRLTFSLKCLRGILTVAATLQPTTPLRDNMESHLHTAQTLSPSRLSRATR